MIVSSFRGVHYSLITITEQEFAVVRTTFDLQQNIVGTPYYVRDARPTHHDVVLRRTSAQTNLISAEAAGDVVQDFRPSFLILLGTAGGYGGRDGLALGDVVVSDYVEFSGYWKYKADQIIRRKIAHDHPSLYLRDNFVEPLRVTPTDWRPHVTQQRPTDGQSTIFIGEVVSGDVLLGDPDNTEQKRILDFFDKALAFEMEAVGVARTMFKARQTVAYNPQFLVIRGISDLVNEDRAANQQTRVAWTPYAVGAAAAVGRILVERLLGSIKARESADKSVLQKIGGLFGVNVIN